MSLTDEQIEAAYMEAQAGAPYMGVCTKRQIADAIESAATAPLLERIAELDDMNTQLREQNTAVDTACADLEAHIEQLERELATERALSFRDQVAELEQRNRDLYEDMQRFKEHALNEKDARMAIERELDAAKEQP